jgi:hypothetical protein
MVLEAVLRMPIMDQRNSSSEKERGWVDPRLDGGSFLDVSVCHHREPIMDAKIFVRQVCHQKQRPKFWRTSKRYHIVSFRPIYSY